MEKHESCFNPYKIWMITLQNIEEPWVPMVIGIYKKTKDSVSALSIFREALAVKQDVDENLCGDFFGWKIII